MNGRGFKLLTLLAILVLALGATGAAFAAPPPAPNATGQDSVCPHDTDGWSSHQEGDFTSVEGATSYCAKGGSDQAQGCTGYLITGSYETVLAAINAAGACGLSHWSYQTAQYELCSVTVAGTPGPWSDWTIDPQDESRLMRTRTIPYYDSVDTQHLCREATEVEYMDRPVCPYNPELWADDPACVPPPGGASGSFTPYCGGGINVVLANAWLYIDDLDPITANGSYGFNLGEHDFLWEALQGFEFPDGFVTEGSFTINSCPPPEEPPTGPEGALPIAEGLAFLAFSGLGALGIRRMKKH